MLTFNLHYHQCPEAWGLYKKAHATQNQPQNLVLLPLSICPFKVLYSKADQFQAWLDLHKVYDGMVAKWILNLPSRLPEGMAASQIEFAEGPGFVSHLCLGGWVADAWHHERPSALECFSILHTAV